jgi:integrase
MKQHFTLFRRGDVFYCEDAENGKQVSLRTKNKAEAQTLLYAKNESVRQPILNLQIARTYLTASDPAIAARTWQDVMNEMTVDKEGSTLIRYERAMLDKAFDPIRKQHILETHSVELLKVLRCGTVATNVFLRRIHNFAVGMGWLPWPILAKKQWPKLRFKEKRAITAEEHHAIITKEGNPERRAFYQCCWLLGGAQSDIASLTAEDIDWRTQVVSFSRQKTGSISVIRFGAELAAVLRVLPRTGALFPKLFTMREGHRATEFKRCCRRLKINGITLHSYRYAWAERAKTCGYPERFAQAALGHNSKAVHRAYARKAHVIIPTLEEFEKKMTAFSSDSVMEPILAIA